MRFPLSRALLTLCVIELVVAIPLAATSFVNPVYGYSVDLPTDWQLVDDADPAATAFSNPNRQAVLQIIMFPPERFATATEMGQFVHRQFNAQADKTLFYFQQQPALFAAISFFAGRQDIRGYGIYIDGQQHDVVLLGYAPVDYYEQYHDRLLSAIDSFSLAAGDLRHPGPVGSFLYQPPETSRAKQDVPFEDRLLHVTLDLDEAGANQTLIEREARIFASYRNLNSRTQWIEAWQRYYRMIYRDSYVRLTPLAHELNRVLGGSSSDDRITAQRLLDWLQNFHYRRGNRLSDLISPITAALESAGDCDSLGLLYVILLHHLGYDAILMVSDHHQHAMVGVDLPGEGARFDSGGIRYLVAELTTDVPLGRIAQSMADPADWHAISFPH